MKSNEIITFQNPVIGDLRGFVDKQGEPWFLSGQVCRCLGIKDSTSAIKQLKQRLQVVEDYYKSLGQVSNLATSGVKKIKIDNGNFGQQEVFIVNEQGLYELIFGSRKQTAIVFRAWVTGEVLPALRKHGEYRMQGKLIRRSLTDTIKTEIAEKTDNLNEKRFCYSNFSKLINKSLGLPDKVDRNSLDDETLEKLARRENLIQSMIAEGKNYNEIKKLIFEYWGVK